MTSFSQSQPDLQVRRLSVPRPVPVGPAPLEMGDQGYNLTTRYVTRAGQPWIPVMGEYHYSRALPGQWEQELRKMKAGGINVVSTYLLWILHEESQGQVRWDGHRDLREFVRIADEAGLKVIIRIGPWAHGETRNGGFPDWLQALPIQHRTDDPAYLDLVRGWYVEIEQQVRGLFHSETAPQAPIIGIQIENELYDQREHLRTLRVLAEEVGLKASLWTATGWGGAELPVGRVLPVYAGYSDGFWEESTTGWPAFGPMHFSFSTIRDDLSVGADLRDEPAEPIEAVTDLGEQDPWPFATCELGGGMQVAYHRRPFVDADDVAALALTKIGSGSAWQGYYLYHGATQVIGELSPTQESQATGYPNDLPLRDYDFYAPIGAAGGIRPHFHKLRRQHLFLEAFGAELATCPAVLPELGDVRWSVRGDGDRAYLFVNNHQPAIAALPDVECVRFEVELGESVVTVPQEPVRLRSGAYFTWPVRQTFGSIPALTVTAQPITQIQNQGTTVVLFAASPGIGVELQLEGVTAEQIQGADVETREGLVIARPKVEPGLASEVRVGDTTLVFLDEATADAVWKGEVDGRETLLIWAGSAWFDGGFRVVPTETEQALYAYPPLAEPAQEQGSVFARYQVPVGTPAQQILVPEFEKPTVAPVRTGGSSNRFSAPLDEDFAALDAIAIKVPEGAQFLTLNWTGDVVRLYAGELLIADQFWSGRPLELDLTPYQDEIRSGGLWLKAFAWSPDSGVYVDPRVRPDVTEPVLVVHSASVSSAESRLLH